MSRQAGGGLRVVKKYDKWFKARYGAMPLNGPEHSKLFDRQAALERELLEVTASLTTAYRFDRDYEVGKKAWEQADYNARTRKPGGRDERPSE